MDYYSTWTPLFKALSDETRLQIIDLLSCGELCACDILENLSITQPTLSYHMKILADSNLVQARKDGSWMKYTLNQEHVDSAQRFFDEITKEKENCICKRCAKKMVG